MKKEKFRRLWRRAVDDPQRADISVHASSGAYYLFLSLGPLVVLLLSVLPYTPLTEQQLLQSLLGFTPEPFRRLVNAIVTDVYTGSLTFFSISFIAELWSAAKFLSSVLHGVGEIYDDGGRYDSFFRRRFMGALYTLALLVFILGNLTLLFFGERLLALAQSRFPAMEGFFAGLLRLRSLIFLVALTLVIALLFRYIPHKDLRFWRQLPGAAFSAVVWLLFSRAYSWAVQRFAFFSVYGSLAMITISLFWMYCSLYILFLGAWLNTLGEKFVK